MRVLGEGKDESFRESDEIIPLLLCKHLVYKLSSNKFIL